MKLTLLIAAAAMTLGAGTASAAANVEVEWQNPKKYTDIRPSNESRKRFIKRTTEHLQEYITELAEDLPDGQTLKMVVTDVDLAGRVQPANFAIINTGFGFTSLGTNNFNDIRVIERVDIPRMAFSFELLDTDGQVIKSGEENIKDLGFQDRALRVALRNDPFRYEQAMLKDWFRDTFPELLAKN